jgi:hypothetical protein
LHHGANFVGEEGGGKPKKGNWPMRNKSRMNALKHGAYSNESMLWGEDYSEYESLLTALNEEWAPEGSSEEYLVQKLAKTIWCQRRLDRYEQIKTKQTQENIQRQNELYQTLENIFPRINDFARAGDQEKVEELLSTLDPTQANFINSTWPSSAYLLFEWGPAIASGLSSYLPIKRYEGSDEFARIVELMVDDKILASEERLNATFDWTIKRLVQLKAVKQMYRRLEPSVINNSASKIWKSENATPARIGQTKTAASAPHSRRRKRTST